MEPGPELHKKRSILTQGPLPMIVEAEEVSKLEGKKLEELEEAFSLFDIDGNGLISSNELVAVLKSFGKEFEDEDIKEMLEIADKDGDGEIGFDDFHDLMKDAILCGIQEEDLKEAFDVFDSDKDGFISPLDMQKSFVNLGEAMSMSDILDMIKDIDTNSDGLIDFSEFKSFYKKGNKEETE